VFWQVCGLWELDINISLKLGTCSSVDGKIALGMLVSRTPSSLCRVRVLGHHIYSAVGKLGVAIVRSHPSNPMSACTLHTSLWTTYPPPPKTNKKNHLAALYNLSTRPVLIHPSIEGDSLNAQLKSPNLAQKQNWYDAAQLMCNIQLCGTPTKKNYILTCRTHPNIPTYKNRHHSILGHLFLSSHTHVEHMNSAIWRLENTRK